MKKFITILVLSLLMLGLFCTTAQAAPNIKVVVDGKAIVFTDAKPFVDKNYRTQVPMRALAEALGCYVNYIPGQNGNSAVIDISKKTPSGLKVQAKFLPDGLMGTHFLYLQNRWIGDIYVDTDIVTIKSRTYLPARYVAENFGYNIRWDGMNNTVYVDSNPNDVLFNHTNSYVSKSDLMGTWKKTNAKGDYLGEVTFMDTRYNTTGSAYMSGSYQWYSNTEYYYVTNIERNILEFNTKAWDVPSSFWNYLQKYEDECMVVLLDKDTAMLVCHWPYSDYCMRYILEKY